MTKFLIVGAGAIGGFLGAVLSRENSYQVTMIARGAHLQAMKKNGLHVKLNSLSKTPESFVATRINYAANLQDSLKYGPFDVVFLCVKAQQLIDIARDPYWLKTLHDRTILVPLQNGLPWYLFLSRPASDPFHGIRLKSVDPTGELEKAFETRRIVGCIAMPASTLVEPGVIDHEHGWSFPLPADPQAKIVAELISKVGFRPKCHENFEEELWLKSLGSAIFNPVSALTGAVLGEFADDPKIVAFTYKVMNEVRSVASAIGITIPVTNEKRLQGATRIGDHKTSMLQDVEAGKPSLEIDALVASVVEVAEIAKVNVPTLEVILNLVRMKQRSLAREAAKKAKL